MLRDVCDHVVARRMDQAREMIPDPTLFFRRNLGMKHAFYRGLKRRQSVKKSQIWRVLAQCHILFRAGRTYGLCRAYGACDSTSTDSQAFRPGLTSGATMALERCGPPFVFCEAKAPIGRLAFPGQPPDAPRVVCDGGDFGRAARAWCRLLFIERVRGFVFFGLLARGTRDTSYPVPQGAGNLCQENLRAP